MTDELNKIKFDFDHAKTTTQQSLEVEDLEETVGMILLRSTV